MAQSSVPDYRKSLDYLFGLQKYGIKFGLNSTERILERIGNPHQRLRCIHVAGTNGKGSTAAMLSSVLQRHGYRVGLYTSPHLVRFTERFRINEREISVERMLDVFERIRAVLDPQEPPTFFEMVTAMAFLVFAEEELDWAVIEVGMGGRLDATNVIMPRVGIITTVALDHQEFLGYSLTAIAREKAGIIKNGVPLVTGVRQPAALGVIKAACLRHEAPLYCLGRDFDVRRDGKDIFLVRGLARRWPSLEVSLPGRHQMQNAAVSLAALEVLEMGGDLALREEAVREGLLRVEWPARLEVLGHQPTIVLDGAHNPEGAETLRHAIRECFTYRHLHLVVGIMADKDIDGVLRRLLPLADSVILTKPRYQRAASPEDILRRVGLGADKCLIIPDVSEALARARELAAPDDLICITGSLYFAGEIKELLGEPVL